MSNVRADAAVIVIFGASGDLTRRKLLPAIYNLAESGHLPEKFAIIGLARQAIDEPAFRQSMRESVLNAENEALDPGKWERIEARLHYLSGEFTDPATVPASAGKTGRGPACPRRRHPTIFSTWQRPRINSVRSAGVWRTRDSPTRALAGGA